MKADGRMPLEAAQYTMAVRNESRKMTSRVIKHVRQTHRGKQSDLQQIHRPTRYSRPDSPPKSEVFDLTITGNIKKASQATPI